MAELRSIEDRNSAIDEPGLRLPIVGAASYG
jgi:hypothetical protein